MQKTFILGLTLLYSGVAMASSLVLPSAASLAGRWTIATPARSCVINLNDARVEPANGYGLALSDSCRPDVLSEMPAAWRPTPDGIEFVNKEGLTILFFAREEEHFYRSVFGEQAGKVLQKMPHSL